MTPPRAARAAASALALSGLLSATACSALSTPPTAPKPTITLPNSAPPPSAKASAKASTGPSSALTEAMAQAALVTDADLGEPWTPAQGVATWHDGVLKAKADRRGCQRLLDALYADELFGADARPRAVVGMDDEWNQAQMRYQVLARPPAEIDKTLAWLGSLPRKCAQFAATTTTGAVLGVQVGELPLPEAGDARQGLRVLLTGQSPDGEPTTLTLDVAALRVGEDAISVTNGGFGDVQTEATQAAVQLGAERLAEVRRQGRVQV
ncbi:hypothetical protein M2164_004249 [Streptomyces sp. SAI-208]|jgi:hypothetical protein|uniref:hypothetical protein n=1 Tax=Streptomyces sp. SAI-208 TaxID=2940550 RepID=UPI0024746E8C|nr:hypothetical protein [Streptomyces sp. SAI-208]MDH6608614.1 hypothetical protein [Streptomyces sp. SAI-208]